MYYAIVLIITMLPGIQFFDSASGVAGLAGAIASNPIDVVKVSQVVVSTRFCKNVVVSKQINNMLAVLAFFDQ